MLRDCAARAVLGIVAILGLGGTAHAELGDGIRLGEFDVRPVLQAEAGYQTNVRQLADPTAVDHTRRNDWVVRLVPQVSIERAGGRAKLAFHAVYDWRKYAYNPELDARDNFEIGLSGSVNEDRIVGASLENRFRIQSRPTELELLGSYRRASNAARVTSQYRPGTALAVTPAAYWLYDRFTSTRGSRVFAERHTTGVSVDARWAFLSRTVLAVTGEGGQVRYTRSVTLPGPPASDVNSGSTYFRVDTGIVGQVRPKLNIAVKGGYGQARYPRSESLVDLRGLTAVIKGEWTPRVTNLMVAGYERTFSDVFFTNFGVTDRAFGRYRHLIAGEWIMQGNAAAEWQEYSHPFARRDFVLRAEPSVRRVLRRWADVGVAYAYERRWSHEATSPTPASADAPSDYTTHHFMATASLQF